MKKLLLVLVVLTVYCVSFVAVAWGDNQHADVVSMEKEDRLRTNGVESELGILEDALTFTIYDPDGDSTFWIDVFQMDMRFSKVSGDYRIILTADPAEPFVDDFRINLNLFNPDTNSNDCSILFFHDTLNDYDLITPTLQITLTGTSPTLTYWNPGDRVFTSTEGAPPHNCNSYFRSSVVNFDFGEDRIAYQDQTQPAIIMSQAPTDVGLTDFSQNSDTVNLEWMGVVIILIMMGVLFFALLRRRKFS